MKPDLSFLRTWANASSTIICLGFFMGMAAMLFSSNVNANPIFDILYARILNVGFINTHWSSVTAITLVAWYVILKDRLKGIGMNSMTIIAIAGLHDMVWNLSYHLTFGFFWPMDYFNLSGVATFAFDVTLFTVIGITGKKWHKYALLGSLGFLSVYYAIAGYWLKIPETLYNGAVRYATSFTPNFVEVAGWIGISLITLASYVAWRQTK